MSSVMIVENESKPLWMAKKLLSAINYDVTFVTNNGFEAVEKFPIIQPDLVISDLTLSKSDGKTMLKEIKKNHPESKIVIISSLGGSKIEDCLKLGANACMTNPIKLKEFVTVVTSIEKSDIKKSKVAPIILDE